MGSSLIFSFYERDALFLGKELGEFSSDDSGYDLRCSWFREAVCSAVDLYELGAGRDQFDGRLKFVDGPEGIFRSADEKRRRSQLWKVSSAQLSRFSRRMERIRQQQKTFDQTRIRCQQKRGLAASVGAAAQKGASRKLLFHQRYGAAQPFLIFFCSRRRRRTMWTSLAIWQVAAQDTDSGSDKLFGHGNQQRSVRISAGAMCQHQEVAGGTGGAVQRAPHRRFSRRFIHERTDRWPGHPNPTGSTFWPGTPLRFWWDRLHRSRAASPLLCRLYR